jgi:hypothetical protein
VLGAGRFGSEPKAIIAHPQWRPELDADGISELFGQIGTRTPGHLDVNEWLTEYQIRLV